MVVGSSRSDVWGAGAREVTACPCTPGYQGSSVIFRTPSWNVMRSLNVWFTRWSSFLDLDLDLVERFDEVDESA